MITRTRTSVFSLVAATTLALIAHAPVKAQTTPSTFDFSNPASLGQIVGYNPAQPNNPFPAFVLSADKGNTSLKATFAIAPADKLSQFSVTANNAGPFGVSPFADNLLFGQDAVTPAPPPAVSTTIKLFLTFSRPLTQIGFDWVAGQYDALGNPAPDGINVTIPGTAINNLFVAPTAVDNGAGSNLSQGVFSFNPGGGILFSEIDISTTGNVPVFGLDNIKVASVPEPGTMALGMSALLPAGIVIFRRNRRRK